MSKPISLYVKSMNYTPIEQAMIEPANNQYSEPFYHVRQRLTHEGLYCGYCDCRGHECVPMGTTDARDLAPILFPEEPLQREENRNPLTES